MSMVFILCGCGVFKSEKTLDRNSVENSSPPLTQSLKCTSPATLVPRLTPFEYNSILNDILGSERDRKFNTQLPQFPNLYGFDRISSPPFDRTSTESYFKMAETVSTEMINNKNILSVCLNLSTPTEWTWENCGQKIITKLGMALFRRPIRKEEEEVLKNLFLNLYKIGQTENPSSASSGESLFKETLKGTLITLLMFPQFLFKLEYFSHIYTTTERPYQVAAQLSLLIGSTFPDEELQNLAANNLLNQENLYQQATRLLTVYADRFITNFAGQWLGFYQNLSEESESLSYSMGKEAELVFREVLLQENPISSLLSPGFTYVNNNLGNHYNLTGGSTSSEYRKVNSTERGGLLSQAYYLVKTSNALETRPIKRGVWVLDKILCRSLPPLTAATLAEIAQAQSQIDPKASVSERMALHRNSGNRCSSCHNQIDPIGLGLENWDYQGLYRTHYADGKPIISQLSLNGHLITQSSELVPALLATSEFPLCVQRKLNAFINGLNPTENKLCGEPARSDQTLKSLILNTLVDAISNKNQETEQ